MSKYSATARSHPNIALIKYWGKRDILLNLPAVPSLSLTLSKFHTTTTVNWGSKEDQLVLNGSVQDRAGNAATKVFDFLNLIDSQRPPCKVISENNFPTAAGLASSASAFSALAMAGCAAAEIPYSSETLSVFARRGSGSASRSIFDGWVEWRMGERDDGLDSHGVQLAPANHWDVRMVMAVVSEKQKPISSRAGMMDTQRTSPMYRAWCQTANTDLEIAKSALYNRDLDRLGTQMEHSTLKMFSTMFTTMPSIRYWKPQTIALMEAVERLRQGGLSCYYTMDAGPNVKVLCHAQDAAEIADALKHIVHTVHILEPGNGTHLI